MHDLLPEGEELRRAAAWVADHLKDDPGHSRQQLVQEATFRFNLSPRDTELLADFFRPRPERPES